MAVGNMFCNNLTDLSGGLDNSMAESTMIFKVCSKTVWEEIRHLPSWTGSPHDLRDGFIHFSTASQLAGTLQKHYAGQTDLMLLTIDAGILGDALKWEPSRGGDLFPHLYGPLPITSVVSAQDLTGTV
jgi:uncharacterized protein (DUF952 family)